MLDEDKKILEKTKQEIIEGLNAGSCVAGVITKSGSNAVFCVGETSPPQMALLIVYLEGLIIKLKNSLKKKLNSQTEGIDKTFTDDNFSR